MEQLFIDDALLVVNKPAGLPVLPDGWENAAPYLLQQIERECGKVWIVHRLDKVTSGVLIVARTAATHRHLSMQFERHEALKTYHAIVCGSPPWDEKIVRQPLRIDVGHKHRTQIDHRRGKPSQTDFKVLERYAAHALVEARPITGRTHQVRAHLSAIGFPLLADLLYGAPATDLIGRPALHAFTLSIVHPVTGQALSFTAPYPPDLSEALGALRAPGT